MDEDALRQRAVAANRKKQAARAESEADREPRRDTWTQSSTRLQSSRTLGASAVKVLSMAMCLRGSRLSSEMLPASERKSQNFHLAGS